MDYDVDKHNWYIPGLWHGVPPMAPVNTGYSENVYKLKQYLLDFMKSQKGPFSITGFISWIESLWKAVKHEKFIFSFINSLVAEAYNNLSVNFSHWEWDFHKKVYNWIISTENKIKKISQPRTWVTHCHNTRVISNSCCSQRKITCWNIWKSISRRSQKMLI